jgi:hypothetical protein
MALTAYHWSPATRRASIRSRGLVIGATPCVNGVEDDHRNTWISLSPTPAQAWWLSGQALPVGGFTSEYPIWDPSEVDLTEIERTECANGYPAIRAVHDIPPDKVTWIGVREFGADAA